MPKCYIYIFIYGQKYEIFKCIMKDWKEQLHKSIKLLKTDMDKINTIFSLWNLNILYPEKYQDCFIGIVDDFWSFWIILLLYITTIESSSQLYLNYS